METELETPPDGRITDGPVEGIIQRVFETDITVAEGRTIDVRIVPYGERAMANDGMGGLPKGIPYQEEWLPGAFSPHLRPKKVYVNFEHQQGLAGLVGNGIALREAADGFYGSFKLHETPEGEKALMLVREGVLDCVSMEVPMRTVQFRTTAAGIVQRMKGHLLGIGLCRQGAYDSAVVLAVRSSSFVDEDLMPVDMDPELVERCRQLGIPLPQRYETHPAEPGTPADAGTPEAAPVVDESQPTSEGTQ